MYLCSRKNNGLHYLCLLRSYREPGKRSPRIKVVYNFGRLSSVSARTKEWLADKELKAKLTEAVQIDIESGDTQSAVRKIVHGEWDPESSAKSNRSKINKLPELHYGHLVLKQIWDNDFKLKYKINYLQDTTTNVVSWKLNDLLFYFCTSRILNPLSYKGLYEQKEFFLYSPWEEVVLDSYYETLDFLEKNMNSIISYAVKRYTDKRKTAVNIAFFDCTNTWFETPVDDRTRLIAKYFGETAELMRKQGKSEEEIGTYLCSDEYALAVEAMLLEKKDEILRMRGNSKEGRYMQPIITIALVMDQEGFPIDLKVFPGNLSEMRTVSPVLQSLKAKYDIKDVYFVADKGLNSTANLETISSMGLGYIVAQKVLGLNSTLEKEILDSAGYSNYMIRGEKFVHQEGKLDTAKFRFKVCDWERSAYVEAGDGRLTRSGRPAKKKITIKSKIMFVFSPSRQAHDLKELQSQIERAEEAVAKGISLGNPYQNGWRSLLKTDKELQSKDKDGKDQFRVVGLKEDVIERRKRLAGYSALVFNHPHDGIQLPIEEIIWAYHRLVEIEDCFKVMKSQLALRPMFVRLYSRIRGHCCVCFIALMLLRALQDKLEQKGVPMSTERIVHALWDARVVPVPDGKGKVTLWNITGGDNTYSLRRAGKGKIKQDINAVESIDRVWEQYALERAKTPDDTDTILVAAGLSPLPLDANLLRVKRALKVQSASIDDMIPGSIQRRLGVVQEVVGTA